MRTCSPTNSCCANGPDVIYQVYFPFSFFFKYLLVHFFVVIIIIFLNRMKSRIKKKITVYSRVRGARRVSLERARERERANSVKERVI